MSALDDLLAIPESPVRGVRGLWHEDPRDKDPRSETQRVQAAIRLGRIIAPGVDIVAVPNAGRRSRWEANERRREGMVAGALDWVVTWDGGCAFAEWKDGKSMADDNQCDRLAMYTRWGLNCGVFRQELSFWQWLRGCGAPVAHVQL